MFNLKKKQNGFTLLELLIVIAIIAILSVILVIVLNPSESLKKTRDAQRMSDLATLKKAIGLYVTMTPYPKLAGASNIACKGTTSDSSTWDTANDKIYYSYPSDAPGAPITATSLDGVTFTSTPGQVTKAYLSRTDGTGWIPIDFSTIVGGSPISVLPVDPINTIVDKASPKSTDLVYRYICSEKNLTYEVGATLESSAYTVADNKMAKDGGTADSYYEVGTGLGLMSLESPVILACGAYTVTGSGLDINTYGTILGADGRCWLDRNLGATRVATAFNDTSAYGYLYQWGRAHDGHQVTNSATSSTLSATDSVGAPDTAKFITNGSSPYDWRSPQNNNLWQGVNGVNNVCPAGFRLPTQTEWSTLTTNAGITNSATAYSSSLKLTVAGYRDNSSASLASQGSFGYYWSSSVPGTYAYSLLFDASSVYPAGNNYRAYGFTVRCLKN